MSEYIYASSGEPLANSDGKISLARKEIVRCRDCKYGQEVFWPKAWGVPADYLDCRGPLVTKWDYYNDEPQSNPVNPNGFCAWGNVNVNS